MKNLVEVYVKNGVMYYSKKYIDGILNYLEKWLVSETIKLDIEWEEMSNEVSCINNFPLGGKVYISHVEVVYACGCVDRLSPNTSYMKGGHFEIVDGRIVYRIHDNESCCNCGEVAAIKNSAKPDSLLQQAIYSHGLATGFSGKKSWQDVEESFFGVINACENGGEICCSWKNQCIGGFGIFVQGEVTLASNRDLWSSTNKAGDRIFDSYDNTYTSNIITSKEELDFTVWDHTEFFVKPKTFYGFWIKKWFYSAHKAEIDEFVKKGGKNVKLYVIKNRRK